MLMVVSLAVGEAPAKQESKGFARAWFPVVFAAGTLPNIG
jgi:hypothetical protein